MHLWRFGAPNSQNKIPIMPLGPKIIPKYLVDKPPQILQTLLSVGNWSEAELTVITCSATHNPCTLFFRKGLHKHVFHIVLHKFARQLAAVADFCFYKCLTAAENELSLKEGQFHLSHFSSQALIQRQEGVGGQRLNEIIIMCADHYISGQWCAVKTLNDSFVATFCFLGHLTNASDE